MGPLPSSSCCWSRPRPVCRSSCSCDSALHDSPAREQGDRCWKRNSCLAPRYGSSGYAWGLLLRSPTSSSSDRGASLPPVRGHRGLCDSKLSDWLAAAGDERGYERGDERCEQCEHCEGSRELEAREGVSGRE